MRYLLVFLILIPVSSFAQYHWNLKKESDGISVYMREVDNSPFKEIMVKMQVKSTLEEFTEIISDVDSHKKWVYGKNMLELIKEVSDTEIIYYTEFGLPWPASNRDVILHLKVVSDSIPNKVFVESRAVSGYAPLKKENVRIVSSRAFWEVEKINSEVLKIKYTLRLDPAGSLPPWLVNMTSTIGPFNSFSALKDILEN